MLMNNLGWDCFGCQLQPLGVGGLLSGPHPSGCTPAWPIVRVFGSSEESPG